MSDRPTPTEAGTPDVDVHVLPLGKKKGDEGFVEGYRRKGPEGLTRELVVLEVDDKGATKVADKIRQLLEKKLTSFVVDLTAVPALEGAALKEFVRAKKMAEEKAGYFSIAGAKEAVAGLLKVMGLDKEIASHNNVSTAVEQFKWHLQTKIAEKTGAPAPAAPAAAAPAQRFMTGEMVAVRPEGRLAVEQIDGDFLFYPPGKKPAKKDMAGDTMMLALSVRANNIGGLADEIRRAAGTGTNRILANLFELGAGGEIAGIQLAAAMKAAEEKKARVVFSGASPETISSMQSAGIAVSTVVFESEVAAAEQLAVELLEQKQKKGVRLKRIQGEIDTKAAAPVPVAAGKAGADDRKPGKTMQMATPTFDEEPEARPAKTAQFAAPKFDEDDEAQERKPGKTMQMSTPKFDDDDEEKEERKPGKTQMYAAPKFDEDDEERKPGKTAQMSVPKFDDDEEKEERKPGKTQMYAAPKFDEDEEERKPGKTAQMSVPKFDEDDEEERRPGKTAQMSVPKFDDDEEPERKPAKTAQMATPKFDDDEGAVGAPTFFEEGDISSASKKKADGKPDQKVKTEPDRPAFKPEGKAKTDPERPAMKPEGKAKTDPERPAAGAFQEMKTQAMVGLSREEALRLAAEASGKPMPAGKSKTEPPRPAPAAAPAPAPAPAQPQKPKTEPAKAAAPAGIQEAKTQAMPGLSREEAMRLAAEASGKAAPAGKPKTDPARPAAPAAAPAPSQPQKPKTDPAKAAAPAEGIQEMKTQAMSGLTKEEALRLAAEASGKAPAGGKPKTDPSRPAAAPAAQPPKAKTEPMRAAAPAALQEMKTQAMSGLSKEEALRLAAEASGKPAPGGAKDEAKGPQRTEVMKAFVPAEPPKVEESKPQKTEVMKAFVPEAEKVEDVRVAKTQAISGLSREEALKLAAEAGGKPQPKPQSKPDIRAQKTEVLQAAVPEPAISQVAKTEMFQGLSKEEAMKLAAGEAAAAKKGGPAEKKTGDMKAKTDPVRQAAPQKTEQMKAFTPEPAASPAQDMKVMKTEAMAGLTKEEAIKLANEASGKKPAKGAGTAPMMSAFQADAAPKKNDQQAMKTEAMAGLTKEEAIKLAKSGEAGGKSGKSSDIQDFQTDRMQSPKREQAEFQQSKTQAFDGMTREQAEQEAKTDPERRAARGVGGGDSSEAPEAEAKKSPMMMIAAVVVIVAAVGGWFIFGPKPESTQVDQKKLEAAEKKIEAALLDALDFEGN